MIAAVISLTGLGFVAAFGLSLASKKFHVEVDPRQEIVEGILPSLNCGACGYAGCAGFAEGLLAGEVEVTGCAPGGETVVNGLAEFLGLEVGEMVRQVVVLRCGGAHGKAVMEAEYQGVQDCRAAILIGGGGKACRYSCVGYGTCEVVCPFDAIVMAPQGSPQEGLPIVDTDKCTACNKCVVACPRDVLALEPVDHQVRVWCSSKDKGGRVKKVCSVGCNGCGICDKVCPVDAITVDNFLASIDPEKCVECGLCAARCPTDSIVDEMAPRPPVVISDACNGCTICAKVCPADAITGEAKLLHVVDPQACVGCLLCVERCKPEAISVIGTKFPAAVAK
jgi:Na+-translocating ferredoxin:NAD+ oxidoreductase RNF subunit RnfB